MLIDHLKEYYLRFFGKRQEPISCVLACSGGVDSRVLLDLLSKLPDMWQIKAVLHVNHNLRATSDRDMVFVEDLAKIYGLPCHVLNVCPCSREGTNESWGREMRYAFFEERRSFLSAEYVLTAHHADDEIETFLFKLITGRNNYDFNFIAARDEQRRILRPLISCQKSEIITYANTAHLAYVEDETNADSIATRNIIRNDIIPHFSRINRNYREHLLTHIEGQAREKQYLLETARRSLQSSLLEILTYPKPIAVRIFREMAKEQISESYYVISNRKYEELFDYMMSRPSGLSYFEMGSDIKAEIDFRLPDQELRFLTYNQFLDIRRREKKHDALSFCFDIEEDVVFYNEVLQRKYIIGATAALSSPESVLLRIQDRIVFDSLMIESLNVEMDESLRFAVSGCFTVDLITKQNQRRIKKIIKNKKMPARERNSLIYVSLSGRLAWIPYKSFIFKRHDPAVSNVKTVFIYLAEVS